MKAQHGELKAMVLSLCDKPEGMSLAELRTAINRQPRTAMSTSRRLIDQGELFMAGVKYFSRYFTRKEHADAFALVAKAEYEKHKELMYQKRLAHWREKCRKAAEKKRLDTKVRKPRKSSLQQTKPYVPQEKPKAQIIWPEHVQVQKIPTRVDDRFTFTPEPGWRGEITRDWMNHRLQQASGSGA